MQIRKKGPSNRVERSTLKILERKALSEREKSLDIWEKKDLLQRGKRALYEREEEPLHKKAQGYRRTEKRALIRAEKEPL